MLALAFGSAPFTSSERLARLSHYFKGCFRGSQIIVNLSQGNLGISISSAHWAIYFTWGDSCFVFGDAYSLFS
jgi:hypothetical protein